MAAAKFLDTVSKLLDIAGEARDAVSAYTQVKMTEPPRLLRLPEEECPEIWIRTPPHQRSKSWNETSDPVVPLEGHFCGHLLASLLCERNFEEVLFESGWERVPTWECLNVHKKMGTVLIKKRSTWKIQRH